MRAVFVILAILGAATALSFAVFALYDDAATDTAHDLPQDTYDDTLFTYYDVEHLSAAFSEIGLYMSGPVPITDHTIARYCSYYDGASGAVQSVAYCTTSGITDKNGITVGNLNMGGDTTSPVMALAVLDPVGPLDSNTGPRHAVSIFEGMLTTLVCADCWGAQEPGGFSSIYEWMNAVESRLAGEPDQDTLRSTISGFAGRNGDSVEMTIEAAAAQGGYQWTFTILQ